MSKTFKGNAISHAVAQAQRLNSIMRDLHSASDRELRQLLDFYEAQMNRATRERLRVQLEISRRQNPHSA